MKRISLLAVLVLAGGCQQQQKDRFSTGVSQFGEFSQNLVDYFTGDTALNAAKNMESKYFADERREGIIRLANRKYGRQEPYTTRYAQIAQLDSDYLVRATAVRSLNRARDTKQSGLYIGALSDKHELVRLEACKALSNMPDVNAVPKLLVILNDGAENRDVRIAAADALRHYPQIDVARSLVNVLGEREFGIAWQARNSLHTLTGKEYTYDEAAWLQYLTSSEKPFI